MRRSKLDKIAGIVLLALLACAAGQIAFTVYNYGAWLTAVPMGMTVEMELVFWGALLGLLGRVWYFLRKS